MAFSAPTRFKKKSRTCVVSSLSRTPTAVLLHRCGSFKRAPAIFVRRRWHLARGLSHASRPDLATTIVVYDLHRPIPLNWVSNRPKSKGIPQLVSGWVHNVNDLSAGAPKVNRKNDSNKVSANCTMMGSVVFTVYHPP